MTERQTSLARFRRLIGLRRRKLPNYKVIAQAYLPSRVTGDLY